MNLHVVPYLLKSFLILLYLLFRLHRNHHILLFLLSFLAFFFSALSSFLSVNAFLKEEEMDLLLDGIDFGDDFRGVRDKLIINMFYR